jgi:hypothetical protein
VGGHERQEGCGPEVRVAQQLGIFASLPAIFLIVLLAADVIQPTKRASPCTVDSGG